MKRPEHRAGPASPRPWRQRRHVHGGAATGTFIMRAASSCVASSRASPDQAAVRHGDDGHHDQQQVGDPPPSRRGPACARRSRTAASAIRSPCPVRRPVRTLGRSMILKASIMRIRISVVLTGRMRREGDVAERSASGGAIHEGGLDRTSCVLALERGQQHDEHERDPLPGVADDHRDARRPRVGDPGVVDQAERIARAGTSVPWRCRSSSGTCSRRRPG